MTEIPAAGPLERWSVRFRTEGDRTVSREEVVGLVDAVAVFCGIACGVDRNGYGAAFVVIAASRTEALRLGLGIFDRAVHEAGLPLFPIVHADAVSESEEAEIARRAYL
jgi:hypothetical protein